MCYLQLYAESVFFGFFPFRRDFVTETRWLGTSIQRLNEIP